MVSQELFGDVYMTGINAYNIEHFLFIKLYHIHIFLRFQFKKCFAAIAMVATVFMPTLSLLQYLGKIEILYSINLA